MVKPAFVKRFFCTRERIFLSTTTVVFCVLAGFFSVTEFILLKKKKMYQIVDLATPDVFVISLMGLF